MMREVPPPTIAFCGKPKVGKSSLVNALLGTPVSPAKALEATATALYISDGTDRNINVHREGRVDAEPMHAIREKYTGRDAEEVDRIDLQAKSGFLSNITLVDTPGSGANGSFAERHDEIATAAAEKADLRVFVTKAPSEAKNIRALSHQPLIAVRSHSDLLIDKSVNGADPFGLLKKEQSQFAAVLQHAEIPIFYVSPLIGLGGELLSDAVLEQVLALGACSSETFQALVSSRSFFNEDIPETLERPARLDLLQTLSRTVLPSGNADSAWPFLCFTLFCCKHYQIQDVKRLRETLIDFSGIRELRSVLRAHLSPEVLPWRRLIKWLKVLHATAGSELAALRENISNFKAALAHTDGCEITDTGHTVVDWLKRDEDSRSQQMQDYEKALMYLESSVSLRDGIPAALRRILENDGGIPFSVREQAIRSRRLAENNGDINNGTEKTDQHQF